MNNDKPLITPMVSSLKLGADEGNDFDNPTLYVNTVGALRYLIITRHNIVFVVNKVSQYMCQPKETHQGVVKRILGYLHATINHGFEFQQIIGFVDFDQASCLDTRRYTSGLYTFLGTNHVFGLLENKSLCPSQVPNLNISVFQVLQLRLYCSNLL